MFIVSPEETDKTMPNTNVTFPLFRISAASNGLPLNFGLVLFS
ncbi:hypothetical protein [Paenibacillus sp. SYP-B3998]|nr:hypothetical protein [Paenibacillus sp. SYP-B3998]